MALEQMNFNIAAFKDADAGGNNYYAGSVYEIYNLNDTLADIFSDAAGANPIVQNGIGNVSDVEGECNFYISSGAYYLLVGAKRRDFETGVTSLTLRQENTKYNPATIQVAIDSTDWDVSGGEVFNLKGYYSVGVGGGKWETIISGTTPDVDLPNGTDIRQCVGVANLAIKFIPGVLVSVAQIGVKGDGINNDTAALNQSLKYPSVRGVRSFSVRTTAPVYINNLCDFQLNGMKILGESTLDAEPWIYVRADDVSITGGKLGDGILTGKPIVIGDYSAPDNVIMRTKIYGNKFNVGDMADNRGIISAVGKVFELDVSNKNRFQSGASLAGKNVCCLMMQLSTATVDDTTQMSWSIDKNTVVGIPYLFNNFSNAFAANVMITRNTIRNAEFSLRTYHLHNCTVSENTFIECTELMKIWQRTNFINNSLQRCGDGVGAVKFETPSNVNISNNDIRDSVGVGAVIDGGNSNFTFESNQIWQSSAEGLLINPAFAFGGQIVGMNISNNRITDNYGAGVKLDVTSTLRNMVISGNYFSGNGRANASQVAAIDVDTSDNLDINELVITNNIFRNNDIVGGVQNANTKWALRFSGGTSFSNSYKFSNNYTFTDLVVVDSRASGGGVGTVSNNLVQVLTDPGILGVAWFGNYNETQAQTGHRRNAGTPVGVLVPNWLGEEVYDSGGSENWYKSVGSSLGPWTNTDWKLMT